jgi:hypothetical protein
VTGASRCIFSVAMLLGCNRTGAISDDLVGQHHVLDRQGSAALVGEPQSVKGHLREIGKYCTL